MCDTSKKKPRKSKLIPRESFDIDNNDGISQQELQQSTLSILPETTNSLSKLISTLDEEPVYHGKPDVDISVEVEVESCDEEDSEELITQYLLEENLVKEFYIPKEILLEQYEEVFNSNKTNNAIDRRLKAEILNYLGRFPSLKHPMHKYDEAIQKALIDWRNWVSQAKIRTYIFVFKCQVCSVGFWRLHDFKEHVKCHENVKIEFGCQSHESYLTACNGAWFENICEIQVEGECPRCLKTYLQHAELKKGTTLYHCTACNDKLATCTQLFDHEGLCQKYEKIYFANQMMTDQLYQCEICETICLEKIRYDKHMMGVHSPRTDIPVPVPPARQCAACEGNYITTSSHHCRHKIDAAKCPYCYRQFQNNVLYKAHELGSKKSIVCVVCHKMLKRRCMVVEHYLKHSKYYVMAYKCSECKEFLLTMKSEDLLMHKLKWHKSTRRRNLVDPIIVPKSIVNLAEPPSFELSLSICQETDFTGVDTSKQKPKKKRRLRHALVEPLDNDDVEMIIPPVTKIEISDDDEQIENYYEKIKNYDEKIKHDDEQMKNDYEHMKNNDDKSQSSINFDIKKEKDGFDEPPVDLVINIKTEIKDEIVDENETNDDEINDTNIEHLEKENDEYLKQLSKVFRASKDSNGSLIADVHEEFIVKDEEVDEYEDDIIMLDASKMNEEHQIKMNEDHQIKMNEDHQIKIEDNYIRNIIGTSDVSYSTNLMDHIMANASNDNLTVEVDVSDVINDHNFFMNNKRSKINKTYSRNDDRVMANEENIFVTNKGQNMEVTVKSEPTPGSSKQKEPRVFKCPKCGYTAEYNEYVDHATNVCKTRGKTWSFEKEIFKYNLEKFNCTTCERQFPTFDDYVYHFEDHDLLGQCPKCLKEVDNLCAHISDHMKLSFMKIQELVYTEVTTTKSTGLYQCRDCSEQLKMYDFFNHWESHLELEKKIKEEKTDNVENEDKQHQQCDQDRIHSLITQLTRVDKEKADHRTCVQCKHQFERRNDCKRHVIEHLLEHAFVYRANNKERGITCQVCGDSFYKPLRRRPGEGKDMNEKDQYRLHMRNHGGLPVYKCHLCNKSFSDSSNFAKHKKIHNVHVKAVCYHCGKKFQSKLGLIRHIQIHDTPNVPQCTLCQRVFKCPTTLRKHIRMYHERIAVYTCKFCRTKFSTLRELWDHLWDTHQESKIIADCPYCHRSYRRVTDLKKHVREVHDNNSAESIDTIGFIGFCRRNNFVTE